jgi:solute carrier family 25 thiamine pyrophosphate transporter 19
VRLQVASRSLVACLGHIYRAEGLAGLWKGSVPSMVKAAPNAAITFTMYELAIAWMMAAGGEGGAGGKG